MEIEITKENKMQLLADLCRDDFFIFLVTFWSVIIKEEPVYNWHIKYLCAELQEISKAVVSRSKKPYDLIINIPPGTTKSTITTIMFPAWLWTQDASLRIITNSYSGDLAIEHSVKSRDIITSDLFMDLFPEIRIRRDKRGKGSYENTSTGARYTTSTGGTITGKHAHIIINDDPLNPKQALSDADRETANNHTKTLSSRKVDKLNTPTITIMQRLHEMDVTGYLLKKKAEKIKHICLPAELSDNVKPVELKKKYKNGLLDPDRLSREVLDESKTDLGSREYSGQYDQSPTPAGGYMVEKKWFGYITPAKFYEIYRNEPIIFFMDTAYTDSSENDPTGTIATCKIGNFTYITNAQKVRKKFPDLIKYVPSYVHSQGYKSNSSIRIEPKANGISVIQQLQETTGLNITKTPSPTESKATRLNAASPTIEAGRVILVEGAWNEEFVEEICGFPLKPNDEYVDLICYAIDYHKESKINTEEILNAFR